MHLPVPRTYPLVIKNDDIITFCVEDFIGSEASSVGPFSPERHYIKVIVHSVNDVEVEPKSLEMGFYSERFRGILHVQDGQVLPACSSLNPQNLWQITMNSGPSRSHDQGRNVLFGTHFFKEGTLSDTGLPVQPSRNAHQQSAQIGGLTT